MRRGLVSQGGAPGVPCGVGAAAGPAPAGRDPGGGACPSPPGPREAAERARGAALRGDECAARTGCQRGGGGGAAMAVDITLLFKASVKTVKTRNKALGLPAGDGARDELLRRGGPRPRSDFSARARDVVSAGRERASRAPGRGGNGDAAPLSPAPPLARRPPGSAGR